MIIDSREEFYKAIAQKNIFDDVDFNLDGHKLTVQSLHTTWITFNNCNFNCDLIEFKNIINPEIELEFKNCTFNCELVFSNCNLCRLSINDTTRIKSLDIRKGLSDGNSFVVDIFEFKYDYNEVRPELEADFYFSNLKVNRIFSFENVNQIAGKFQFIECEIGSNEDENSFASFRNSSFYNAFFSRNHFNCFTTFYKSSFSYDAEYLKKKGAAYNRTKLYKNVFYKVDFSNFEISKSIEFDNCDFLGTAWFEISRCKEGNIVFQSCKFEKYTLFDYSTFNNLKILHSKFLDKSSFENVSINNFKIHQVNFKEAAYFDDLNKNNNEVIENWDRKTLRAIKRELVNTHNQIDYLRFKAYELNAYKKEVDKDNLSWKDSLILYFNEESNYFGLDWTKGIGFIFQWSFIFYIFYIISYAARVDEISKLTDYGYFLNYLKFINPFSFLKLPIEDSENYFLPFLFFVIGKIFVSYGIYQTIQAFRKFGVNGG